MARTALPSLPTTGWPRPGAWVLASRALQREVRDEQEPYPHVDGSIVRAPVSGREIKLWRRDCARCGEDKAKAGAA